jgi:hypothetical protein
MVFKSLITSVTQGNLSDYFEDIIDYQDRFKIFTTPFETTYMEPLDIDTVDRIYDAVMEEEEFTGDNLCNVAFRFLGVNGSLYYAYSHTRINYGYDIEDEFIRGTLFITKSARLFFMTTLPSIEENDDLHVFLLEDGLNLCFTENHLPSMAQACIIHYLYQINMP